MAKQGFTQVSATIPTDLFAALEENRWEERKHNRFSGVVVEALEALAKSKGLTVEASADEDIADETPAEKGKAKS